MRPRQIDKSAILGKASASLYLGMADVADSILSDSEKDQKLVRIKIKNLRELAKLLKEASGSRAGGALVELYLSGGLPPDKLVEWAKYQESADKDLKQKIGELFQQQLPLNPTGEEQ